MNWSVPANIPTGEPTGTAGLTRPGACRVALEPGPSEADEQPQRLPRGPSRSGPAVPAQWAVGPPPVSEAGSGTEVQFR